MILTKGDKQIDVNFRLFEEKDVREVIECIEAEYRDTYFKRAYYDENYIIGLHRNNIVTFIMAETKDGGTAGILALKSFYPDETMCEIASQIFKKSFRGFHMAMPMFEYGMRIAKTKDYSCIYALPVTFHDISQVLLRRLGMIGTGFFLSVFLMENENIIVSYDGKSSKKHSQCIQVKPHNKTDVGILYLPRELNRFVDLIYTRLDVNYKIENIKNRISDKNKSEYIVKQDEKQQSCMIMIMLIGKNVASEMQALQKKYIYNNHQTFNVLININDVNAIYAYDALKEMGYIFTGLKPLCSEREYIVMHHPIQTKTDFNSYTLSEEFQELLDMILVINGGQNHEI